MTGRVFNTARLEVQPVEMNFSLKDRVYASLKQAIMSMDIFGYGAEFRLDERQLSVDLGVSRTPIREAMTRLEQEGFVRVIQRRGVFVVRKTKVEILEMITVWAALEGMAARLITIKASDAEIGELRKMFATFEDNQLLAKIDEYSETNIRFHQKLLQLSKNELIHQIAEWDDATTEEEIRADIEEGRDWISRGSSFGDLTSLFMVIGGAVLMGLVFFPRLTGMLRWPGVALLITGAFFFVVGKIVESEVPDRLAAVIETSAGKVSNVPPSVTDLGGDILVSFGSQLTDGFVGPSLTLLVIGAVLLGSSFFTIILGRFVPFVK